jgi:nucleoid DNA-binding protein
VIACNAKHQNVRQAEHGGMLCQRCRDKIDAGMLYHYQKPKGNRMATLTQKPLTKAQIIEAIAMVTGYDKKQIATVCQHLASKVSDELARCGQATLLGLVKITEVAKPAVAGGVTKPNPFKPGETMVTKPRPAKTVVKVRPLKALKDMVA